MQFDCAEYSYSVYKNYTFKSKFHMIPDYNKLSEVEHSVELNNYIMLTRGIC